MNRCHCSRPEDAPVFSACPWLGKEVDIHWQRDTSQGTRGGVELWACSKFIERNGMWPEKRAPQHPKETRGLTVPEGWRKANKREMEREREAGD